MLREAREDEDLAGGEPLVQCVVGRDVGGGFVAGVVLGLAHEQGGESEAETGERDAEEERLGSQSVLLGDVTGRECGEGDGAVAGGFVESHREAAAGGPDEVDLHDDRRRPGESLVDAEQDVGEDDPAPTRCEHQDERDGHGDDPAGDEDGFASDSIREGSGEEVGRGFHGAERDDEGERGGERGDPEHPIREQGKHGAFLTDHPADERVDADEETELAEVCPQSESDGGALGCGHRSIWSARPLAVDQSSGPPMAMHTFALP